MSGRYRAGTYHPRWQEHGYRYQPAVLRRRPLCWGDVPWDDWRERDPGLGCAERAGPNGLGLCPAHLAEIVDPGRAEGVAG